METAMAFLFAMAVIVVYAPAAELNGWACVAELTMPKYPELARQARLGGIVWLTIERARSSWRTKVDSPAASYYA
jgi:hypothetical protein